MISRIFYVAKLVQQKCSNTRRQKLQNQTKTSLLRGLWIHLNSLTFVLHLRTYVGCTLRRFFFSVWDGIFKIQVLLSDSVNFFGLQTFGLSHLNLDLLTHDLHSSFWNLNRQTSKWGEIHRRIHSVLLST